MENRQGQVRAGSSLAISGIKTTKVEEKDNKNGVKTGCAVSARLSARRLLVPRKTGLRTTGVREG